MCTYIRYQVPGIRYLGRYIYHVYVYQECQVYIRYLKRYIYHVYVYQVIFTTHVYQVSCTWKDLPCVHISGMQQTSFGFPQLQSSRVTRLGKMTTFQRTPGIKLLLAGMFVPRIIDLISETYCCRYENILFKGENVLTPKTLQQVEAISLIWIQNSLKLSTISRCTWSTRRW